MANTTWLRLYTEITRDRKLRRLPISYRWIWITILCMAKESPVPGSLLLSDGVAITPDDIADEAAAEISDVKEAMDKFTDLKMIFLKDGSYVVKHWDSRQFVSDNSTERSRKSRAIKQCNVAETLQERCGNVNATPPETETDTETDTYTDKERQREEDVSSVYQQTIKLCDYYSDIKAGQSLAPQFENVQRFITDYGYKWTKEALDLTINKKHKFVISYMEGILKNWKAEGKEETHGKGREPTPGGGYEDDGLGIKL